jgi:hypothetical protein
MNMLLLRPRQIWPAPAAVRAQTMAEGAIDTEFILSCLRRFGIARKGIAIVGSVGCGCGQQQQGRTQWHYQG